MIRPCSSKGYVWTSTSGGALDDSATVVAAGTRVVLSSFYAVVSLSGYDAAPWTSTTYTSLPRVDFMDTSDNVLFGSLAYIYRGLLFLAGQDFGSGEYSINIPGRGILFEDGLKVRAQSPAVTAIKITFNLNLVYEF